LFRHRIIDSHSSCFYSSAVLSLFLVPPLRPLPHLFFLTFSFLSLSRLVLPADAGQPSDGPFRSRSRLLRLAGHTEHIRVGRTRQVSNFRIRYKVSCDRAFSGNRSPGFSIGFTCGVIGAGRKKRSSVDARDCRWRTINRADTLLKFGS